MKGDLVDMKYISTLEAAMKLNVSQRWVAFLCEQQRIPGAYKAGGTWIIPENVEVPIRLKSGSAKTEANDEETGLMRIMTNIETLLYGNVIELDRVEFKTTWDPEISLKTICAFANDINNWGGGYLVIGVATQDGVPIRPLQGIPIEKVDGYQKDILNKCKLILPNYMPIVEAVDYGGKKFIIVSAPGGNVRLYSSPKTMAKDNKEQIYFIRKMSSTIAPSEEEKRKLYDLANIIPFDDCVNHVGELADLNITLIRSFLKEINSPLYSECDKMDFVDLCRSMNIIHYNPEYLMPKNVGLMFFCMNPERFFPYAQIDVVTFQDNIGCSFQEKIFKGPLHHQLMFALNYIRNNVVIEQVIKVDGIAEARRFFNYPFEAIEEALANAVYHKGYDVREPIEVRIETDRIIIISHPGADLSITAQDLKEYRGYSRNYRNRRIGDFLKELHLTERRNTGFSKILWALDRNGSPKPFFETDEARTYFATTLYIHPEFKMNREDMNATKSDIGEVETDRIDRIENKISLTLNQSRILEHISQHKTASIKDIANALSINVSTVDRGVKALKEKGCLAKEGTNRRTTWIVL
jgi:ATP-dependent DNA helicase RecG